LRRVLGKLNTLRDVTFEAIIASLEELLLVVVGAANDVDRLLGTAGTKLNGNGEEVGTSGLGDSITTGDTREVDEAGLDNALLALGGPDHLLGESDFC
jgi:hypothetical protein